jgi:hypothetical protein
MNQRDLQTREITILNQTEWISIGMIVLVSIFILAHLFVVNPDDISMKWAANPDAAMQQLTFSNYRYIPSMVHWAIAALHSTYFHTVAIWSAVYALGLYACTSQLANYVGMRRDLVPWLFGLVSAQSYWIDTYRFTLAYMHFGMGLLFIAGSLYALNSIRLPRVTRMIVATFAAYLSLISYQTFIFLLIFAPSLAIFSAALQRRLDSDEVKRRLVDVAIVLVVSFAAAAITVKVLGFLGYASNSAARAVGIGQAIRNLPVYLLTIIDPFLSLRVEYSKIVPIHERVIFGAAILAALAACLMLRQKASIKWTALALMLASVAILPDPLNLPAQTFWPAPRSMAVDSFFFVFLAFILAAAATRRWKSRIPQIVLTVAGLLSMANQAYYLNVAWQQTLHDRLIASQVIADMRRVASPVHEGSKAGILSTYRNPAQQMDYLFFDVFDSTFTDDWSKLEIIEDTLGFRLERKALLPSDCEGHASPWEIRRIGDATAICMD